MQENSPETPQVPGENPEPTPQTYTPAPAQDPYAPAQDPYAQNSHAQTPVPYPPAQDPYAQAQDPNAQPPYGAPQNPYAQSSYAQAQDPYAQSSYGDAQNPYPNAYGQQGYPQAEAPYSSLAIVGFVLSFIVSLVGMIISIVALVKLKKNGQRGKGLAIAGTIIGAVTTVMTIILTIVMVGLFTFAAVELVDEFNTYVPDSSHTAPDSSQNAPTSPSGSYTPFAEDLAAIAASDFSSVSTQEYEFEVNREAHTNLTSDMVVMTVPAEWDFDEEESSTAYDGEMLFDIDLPSGAEAEFSMSSLPAVEYIESDVTPTVIDTNYIAELFDSIFSFDSKTNTLVADKNTFIGVMENDTAMDFEAYIVLITAEEADSLLDVAFIVSIYVDSSATAEDYDYLISNARACMASAIEYDLSVSRAGE